LVSRDWLQRRLIVTGRQTVARLSTADGSELWSHQLTTGGTDRSSAVDVDGAGSVFVSGLTEDLSTTDLSGIAPYVVKLVERDP
jgi:hypothetical protein